MVNVTITEEAQEEFAELPLTIQARFRKITARLEHWPNVSGAKPLRRELAGNWRIRTGDYRMIFRVKVEADASFSVRIWRIDHRKDVYED